MEKKLKNLSLIIKCIQDYQNYEGKTPTVREIANDTGISKTQVDNYLIMLRNTSILDYTGLREITTDKLKSTKRTEPVVPLVGAVSCGKPVLGIEEIEKYVYLPKTSYDLKELYALKANGDSMIDAGIDDGDVLIIHRQNTAKDGQIAVVLIEDETLLKRVYFEPENNRIRLHPENKAMKDMYARDCTIQGVVVNIVKGFNVHYEEI